MATVPSPDPQPDTGPIESPQPTTPPTELPPMPDDFDQPAAIDEPMPNEATRQAVSYADG